MNWLRTIRSKLSLPSHVFILLYSLYLALALNLAFWRFVMGTIEAVNLHVLTFLISLPFFLLAPVYILSNLITLPRIGKPLLIALLCISSIANYFMYNLGVYIDIDMVRNSIETNQREAFDLITATAVLWFSLSGLLPAITVAFVKIKYAPLGKEIAKRLMAIILILLIIGGFAATSYKEYASFGRNNREARKLLNTVNYIYSTMRYIQAHTSANRVFQKLDENAALVPYEDPHHTVLVLIVGETARAKNFSLYGYARETNPLLKKQDIVTFQDTSSCGTATAISVPCMFSHKARKDFDIASAKYTENLLDILQNTGYKVIWLENDDGCKGVCERIDNYDIVTINNPKYCKDDYCHDEALLAELPERLANITQDTVIVLHTMGSHGPSYYNRYPNEFKIFTPTCDTSNLQNCTQEQVINTYDNTIAYTDFIISSAIDMLKSYPEYEAGLIYVSDHGESLGEKGVYLHGFPYAIAPIEQTQIPMIVWMGQTMQENDFIDYECLKKDAQSLIFSHDNIYHSILGLLEVRTVTYDPSYDIFNNCRTKSLPW